MRACLKHLWKLIKTVTSSVASRSRKEHLFRTGYCIIFWFLLGPSWTTDCMCQAGWPKWWETSWCSSTAVDLSLSAWRLPLLFICFCVSNKRVQPQMFSRTLDSVCGVLFAHGFLVTPHRVSSLSHCPKLLFVSSGHCWLGPLEKERLSFSETRCFKCYHRFIVFQFTCCYLIPLPLHPIR